MKQIDIIKTYAQKRCLIVEDQADTRTALKNMLTAFGATQIDTSGNAEEAIELCRKSTYDIVLADYNLGAGKNGQQLLEELRHEGLLRNTSLYVIITAEANTEYVLYALENQPDEYINKPVTPESLRLKLDQALLRNELVLPVKMALDEHKPAKAIQACEKILEKETSYKQHIKKMLSELLCEQAEYDAVVDMLTKEQSKRMPLWASLSLARAHMGLGQLDIAAQKLEDIISSQRLCVEAQDLMAQLLEKKGKYVLAQVALEKAIAASPRSPVRQREMARVSAKAGDLNAAAHALRAAIKQSKNSCHEQPEDGLNLAQTLSELALIRPESAQELHSEALTLLEQLEKRYPKHPLVTVRRYLIEAEIARQKQNLDQTQTAINEAVTAFKRMKFSALASTSTNLCIDCAKGFMDIGYSDEGEILLQEIAKLTDNKIINIQIDKLLREPRTKEGINHAASLNKKGIALYKAQKTDKAINAFLNALAEIPNHIGVNLNLLQTLLTKSKAETLQTKEVELISQSFRRIGDIADDSAHYRRYQYLHKNLRPLIASSDET